MSASTMGGSGRGRVPLDVGPVRPIVTPSYDMVVRRCSWAVASAAVAVGAAWIGAGGAELGVESYPFLVVAGVCALGAVVAVGAAAIVIPKVRWEVERAKGTRYGTGLAVAATAVTAVVVVGALVLTWPHVADALDEQKAVDAQSRLEVTGERAEPLGTWRALVAAKAGTCLRWTDGPTAADSLGGAADPMGIAVTPCSRDHGYEVLGAVDAGYKAGSGHPGVGTLQVAAAPRCKQMLELLARRAGAQRLEGWGTYAIVPNEAGWRAGAKASCVLVPPERATVRTGSVVRGR